MGSDRGQILDYLSARDPQKIEELFAQAYRVKVDSVGEKVYLRGLIEISNICRKNCLYCGVRSDNRSVSRYELSEEQVLECARFALEAGFGSVVIQGGERHDREFISKITRIVSKVKSLSREHPLGITLSLGEQSYDTYREWFEAGAHRYLLRIESSSEELYRRIHPADGRHLYKNRVEALEDLRRAGYQVGTGVMIGLPFQTLENLADDLLFFKNFDLDMCGMGPYLEHSQTPLWGYKGSLLPQSERLLLSLKMVALLRLLMPDINIAATTAMQAIDPKGRERAVMAGANVMMPNLTLSEVRREYQIYENKPLMEDDDAIKNLPIGWNQWGDSIRFINRND